MDQRVIPEPEWISATKARFPKLFREMDPFNFECGEGWESIVAGLCGHLDALPLPGLRILQIKEKFGDLRVYVEGGDEATIALIREAGALYGSVCEWCGSPGTNSK
jgi:hypothetical protein